MKKLIITAALLALVSCGGKPTQTKFTNFHSHAAVTGLCTAVAITGLRHLDIPSPWNEIGGSVACAAAVTVRKEVLKDPVFDYGDVIANGVGGALTGMTFYLLRGEF